MRAADSFSRAPIGQTSAVPPLLLSICPLALAPLCRACGLLLALSTAVGACATLLLLLAVLAGVFETIVQTPVLVAVALVPIHQTHSCLCCAASTAQMFQALKRRAHMHTILWHFDYLRDVWKQI